jgi:hypothetical protein
VQALADGQDTPFRKAETAPAGFGVRLDHPRRVARARGRRHAARATASGNKAAARKRLTSQARADNERPIPEPHVKIEEPELQPTTYLNLSGNFSIDALRPAPP